MRPARMLALLALAPLAACGLNMTKQARYDTEAPAPLFPDGTSAQEPIPATVAQGQAVMEAFATNPPPVTPALVARGRERFDIFCKPCHGPAGEGNGTIVARGFPHPPSYYSPRLLQAPAQHFFDVITNGYGVMFPYGARVRPADRWAVIAYIRALQLSRVGEPGRPAPNGSAP